MDIEWLIEDLIANLKEQGILVKVLWTLTSKGDISSVKIIFVGRCE